MVLFIGYPINYETACNLFRLQTDTEDLRSTIEKAGLVFQHTDKGQYILGLEVKEVADLWNKFTSVDNGLSLILQKKIEVQELLEKANIDLSDFWLTKMEGEPEHVQNPPLYLISISQFY